MSTPRAEPSPSAASMRAPRWAWLMTIPLRPAARRRSICHTIRGLPPASSSGLGQVSVSGRMRSPRPAARIIARVTGDAPSERVADGDTLGLEPVEQPQQRLEVAVARADAAQVAAHDRDVVQVAGLAVTVREPREDAHDLQVALHAHPLVVALEVREVGAHG